MGELADPYDVSGYDDEPAQPLGVLVEEDRGSLPFALLHGEALVVWHRQERLTLTRERPATVPTGPHLQGVVFDLDDSRRATRLRLGSEVDMGTPGFR